MPWLAGPMTSLGTIVPLTVAGDPTPDGHDGAVPPPHRNAITPPPTRACAKWMCDTVAGFSSVYVSVYVIFESSILSDSFPLPTVEIEPGPTTSL